MILRLERAFTVTFIPGTPRPGSLRSLMSGGVQISGPGGLRFTESATGLPPVLFDPPRHLGQSGGRHYWAFRDRVFSTLEDLTCDDVKALALEADNKVAAKLNRAKALLVQVEQHQGGRQPIPDDVKMFVWQRDGGKCVRCGSNVNLEFDHIIPVVMGGANTARNLQLLCEGCNRAKGGSLV